MTAPTGEGVEHALGMMKHFDWCPICRDGLDTGLQCEHCGADWMPLQRALELIPTLQANVTGLTLLTLAKAETYDLAIAERDQLLAEVREWACQSCNQVYPGPPQPGLMCVICPRCDGYTMPHTTLKTRRAEAERDRLLDDMRFVERVACHHAAKPHNSAESMLSLIQWYPSIRDITRSYVDGVTPNTPDPYAQHRATIEQLQAQLAVAVQTISSAIYEVSHLSTRMTDDGSYRPIIKAATVDEWRDALKRIEGEK